ncbi:hypothetical protein [Streptomyces coffeae]|uniref:Lipoprotein n=1 Tax=Streptomyces coffeae TaxID=621382 RepID=A0ABS1NG02_9ACTN|nr:hypothetical protein [Streptomyces coffeae]MBL1099047.1 hypothetical protein [Streptomyces coffeae]
MHKSTSLAIAAVAVLALTLTGCGGDDKKDSASSDKGGKTTGQTTGKRDTTASSSPSPSRTGEAKKKKKEGSPATSAAPRPTRTSAAPVPTPGRTRTKTAAPARPAGPSSVQGTWYVPVRGTNGLATLTVSGTSWTMAYGGKSCSGTINSGMAISSTCAGETSNGTAVVSNGGENLTFNWTSGEPDRFVRTKPTG